MIGIDTNILVRYITQDNPAQAKRVTLVEPIWILESAYNDNRTQIANTIDTMLNNDTLA